MQTGAEIRAMLPQAKQYLEPPEAGSVNSLWREKDPADILILYVTRKGLHSPELRENKFLLF